MKRKKKKSKKRIRKISLKKRVKRNIFKKKKVRKQKIKQRKKVKKLVFKRKKKSRVKRKTKKIKQPLDRFRAIKLSKFKLRKIKIPKIRIKKRRYFNIKKRLSNLTSKLINAALYPLFRAYDSYQHNRRQKKLKEDSERIKKQEREKKERVRLIKEQKEQELRDQIKFAKVATTEMQVYLRQAEREVRKEKASQQKKILENLKIDKQIQKFEDRMIRETLALEKYALLNLKEAYEPTLEKITALRERYKKLQEEKLRTRISELGVELEGNEDKTALLERERQFIFEKSKIENTLLPYTRSLRSMAFMVNKKYLSRNMSPLKVVDLSMEQGEVYLKWLEEESSEDFLILCYVRDNSLDSGKIVLELKTNPEKYSTLELNFSEIFRFQDVVIDNTVAMLEKMRNQKKAN